MTEANIGLNHGSRCCVICKGKAAPAKPNGDYFAGQEWAALDIALTKDAIGRSRLVSRFGLRPTEAIVAMKAIAARLTAEQAPVAAKVESAIKAPDVKPAARKIGHKPGKNVQANKQPEAAKPAARKAS